MQALAAHLSLTAHMPRFRPPTNIASCDCPAASRRTASYWWTGEDSNLRSPQGAADLQSAGFSHSPTRPRKINRNKKSLVPKKIGTRKIRLPHNQFNNLHWLRAKTQKGLVSKDTSPFDFSSRIRSASLRYRNLVELAEGIEPPTL